MPDKRGVCLRKAQPVMALLGGDAGCSKDLDIDIVRDRVFNDKMYVRIRI